jgi:hypothetical protein
MRYFNNYIMKYIWKQEFLKKLIDLVKIFR